MGLQSIVDQVWPFHVACSVETFYTCEFFRLAHTRIGEMGRVILLIGNEVFLFLQLAGNTVRFTVTPDIRMGLSRDDQRRTGLIDQNIIDLIDNGVI